MSIIEVYEKHKHLDRVLSDPQFCEDSAMTSISRELWLAIKEAAGTASDYERVLLVLKSVPNPLSYEKDCELGRAYRSWFYAARDKLEADEQGLESPRQAPVTRRGF